MDHWANAAIYTPASALTNLECLKLMRRHWFIPTGFDTSVTSQRASAWLFGAADEWHFDGYRGTFTSDESIFDYFVYKSSYSERLNCRLAYLPPEWT